MKEWLTFSHHIAIEYFMKVHITKCTYSFVFVYLYNNLFIWLRIVAILMTGESKTSFLAIQDLAVWYRHSGVLP